MHPEEKSRLSAKWTVWHCPWDKVKQTNMPTTIVSPNFDTRKEAEQYMADNYPNSQQYEYGVFQTDGQTGYY
jgi:hypothetical protein